MSPINPTYIKDVRTGDVWLSDFDNGIISTLGGQIVNGAWYITVDGVNPPPYPHDSYERSMIGERMPGVPVNFASPDDRVTPFVYPCFVIRRESMEEAAQRWPSRHIKYRTPADGATQVDYKIYQTTLSGYDRYEEQLGAYPYDITYAINMMTGGEKSELLAQAMLKHTLRVFPPRAGAGVYVTDSIGETRTYEAFSEGPTSLTEALDIVDRQSGYSVNVRVQAEIDLTDPYVFKAVTSLDYPMHNGVP